MKTVLQSNIELAEKAASVLSESYESVGEILKNVHHKLSRQELESYEALTARFARFSDLMIQKVFRSLDEAELVFDGTIIDRLNRMEKRGIIDSSETWKNLRILRNDIAHEYLIDEAKDTLKDVYKMTPILLQALEKLKKYSQKHSLLISKKEK